MCVHAYMHTHGQRLLTRLGFLCIHGLLTYRTQSLLRYKILNTTIRIVSINVNNLNLFTHYVGCIHELYRRLKRLSGHKNNYRYENIPTDLARLPIPLRMHWHASWCVDRTSY